MKLDLKKDISMPKLTRPKLGKPSMPGRARGINAAPRGRGPEIKVPKFAGDLYRDLRDRHLLPLVALLIVAIIAAPIVFTNKGGSGELVEAAPLSAAETSDSAFTVVPAETTLRSPGKRLGHRQALNPFRQESTRVQLTPSAAGKAEVEAAKSSGSTPSAESSATEVHVAEAPVEPAPVESAPIELPPSEPTPVEVAPPSRPEGAASPKGGEATGKEAGTSTESTTESSGTSTTVVEPQYAVTLKVGFASTATESLEEVQPMTKLPGEKNASILYLGLSPDHKSAMFLLTSKVTAYYGSARCVLDKLSCELVELKAGKSASFEIGLGKEAQRYKVAVDDIEQLEPGAGSAKEPAASETQAAAPNSLRVPNGLASARPLGAHTAG